MSIKIGLLGFGTVASGIPFLLQENGEKVLAASRDQLEIAKVLVKDDEEKNRLLAAGNDYNFVTNVDEILNDDDIQIVVVSSQLVPSSQKHLKQVKTLFLPIKT